MICSKCGYQNPEDATFCNNCGQPLIVQNKKQANDSQIIIPVRKKAAPVVLLVFASITLAFVGLIPWFGVIGGIGFFIPLLVFSIKGNRRPPSIVGACLAGLAIIIGLILAITNTSANSNISTVNDATVEQVYSIEDSEIANDNISDSTYRDKDEYYIGDIAELDDTLVQVISVEKSSGKSFDEPKEGYEYIIVTVAIKNNGDDKVTYSKYDFEMQNSKGQVNNPALTIVDTDTSLNSGELIKNGYVSGTIVFEEPIDDAELKLIYTPYIWIDDSLYFNLMKTLSDFELLIDE